MPHTLPRLPTKTWQQVMAEARLEALDAEQASGDAGVPPRGPRPCPLPPTAVAERTDCAAASQLRRPPTANRPTARQIAAESPAEPSPPSARHPPNACHASCQAPATSARRGCPTGPPSDPPAPPSAAHSHRATHRQAARRARCPPARPPAERLPSCLPTTRRPPTQPPALRSSCSACAHAEPSSSNSTQVNRFFIYQIQHRHTHTLSHTGSHTRGPD